MSLTSWLFGDMPEDLSTSEQTGQILVVATAFTVVFQFLGFLHGYCAQTEKFYDALGAINGVLLALGSFFGAGATLSEATWAEDSRRIVSTTVYILSRSYLLLFLFWRASTRGGDARFDQLKPYFFSYLVVWMLQALWVMCVALPMLVINGAWESAGGIVVAADWIASILMLGGLGVEIVADRQKSSWITRGREGGFCTVGLWSWSRHPNYFGEILLWWAAWGLTAPLMRVQSMIVYCLLAILSPGLSTILLLFVSGIPLAEGKKLERYQQYSNFQAYWDSTSVLIPMPPALWRTFPSWLKLCLFEFPMYQYKGECKEKEEIEVTA